MIQIMNMIYLSCAFGVNKVYGECDEGVIRKFDAFSKGREKSCEGGKKSL